MSTFVDNRTPFSTELFSFPDSQGQEIAVLVLSAAFVFDQNGNVFTLDPQPPVRIADEHFGDPASTSIRYESDTALYKPWVDVILNGSAYAPRGKAISTLIASLEIADIHKELLVLGDRKKLISGVHSRPTPFQQMPICYERAYGGCDVSSSDPKHHKIFTQNPVGFGYCGVRSIHTDIESQLPNIEYADPQSKFAKKIPAGFGAVARSWSPRRELAGTYDDNWLENQWPLLPTDFNDRHCQAAPLDQQSRRLCGGEVVRLRNLTPEGEWRFLLPTLDVPVRLFFHDGMEATRTSLDTVLIEPDQRQVTLSYRLRLPVQRKRPLREIVLGHMTPGWVLARTRGKRFVDLKHRQGVATHRETFQ